MLLALSTVDGRLKQTEKIKFENCNPNGNIYERADGQAMDFQAEDVHRTENISISAYKGKVLLVVNVASY